MKVICNNLVEKVSGGNQDLSPNCKTAASIFLGTQLFPTSSPDEMATGIAYIVGQCTSQELITVGNKINAIKSIIFQLES